MHCLWRSGSLRGVEGLPVRVETQMARGLPGVSLVGLAGAATRESRERVLGAIRESGWQAPAGRVTINLAPAEEPKEGTAFDLAMALGLLEVSGQMRVRRGHDWWLLAELGLDGQLLPIRGALALGLAACKAGAPGIILAPGNEAEGTLLDGIEVGIFGNLREVAAWARGDGDEPRSPRAQAGEDDDVRRGRLDLADVEGLDRVKRALAVAAAGGHNLLLIGSPGNGKSLMARILADLLPPLSDEERRDVLTIRSVAGLPLETGRARPFRSPHHSVSIAGFLGSMTRGGRPGEITLAHRGLLFLDELPEFNRAVREALREPMEDGSYLLSRGAGSVLWPARFQLVTAMNPCPCGQRLRGEEHCRCSPSQVRRYFGRISGPLLDRLDMLVEVPQWRVEEGEKVAATGENSDTSSATMRRRVAEAREALDAGDGRDWLPAVQRDWLDRQLSAAGASFRLREKTWRTARTVAALARRESITRPDILEALDYCFLLRSKLDANLTV